LFITPVVLLTLPCAADMAAYHCRDLCKCGQICDFNRHRQQAV